MPENRIKLWVGVGAYVLLGSGAMGLASGEDGAGLIATANASEKHGASEGGEGGEGGEAGYTSEDPDQQFAVMLQLTRGHIIASREMTKIGNWDFAAAHAQHPAAETYDRLGPILKERGAAPFEAELDALVEQVIKNKAGAPLDQAYDAVLAKIDAALGAIAPAKRGSPAFTAAVALALLQQASAEYAIGVSEGKIVNLQEYQDAHGFIQVADQMFTALDKSTPAVADILAQLALLKATWLPAAQLGAAATPESEILGAISRIELKAGAIK